MNDWAAGGERKSGEATVCHRFRLRPVLVGLCADEWQETLG